MGDGLVCLFACCVVIIFLAGGSYTLITLINCGHDGDIYYSQGMKDYPNSSVYNKVEQYRYNNDSIRSYCNGWEFAEWQHERLLEQENVSKAVKLINTTV